MSIDFIMKLTADANEFLPLAWGLGNLKASPVQHTPTHVRLWCTATWPWQESKHGQKEQREGSVHAQGERRAPDCQCRGDLKRPDGGEFTFDVMASSWFSQLSSFSEAHRSILTRATNVTSKMDAQVGAGREKKMDGRMHTNTRTEKEKTVGD